jgi:gas vesicle protein
MADNVGSKVSYFLVGLGVGALVGVLFAPKSGEDTREYLAGKADEGKDYAARMWPRGRRIRSRQRWMRDAKRICGKPQSRSDLTGQI